MKVFLRTYGCRANHYDSEQIRELLGSNSVQLVECEEDADVGIFNSCSVTADAEADLRQGIRRAARRNSRIRTVVTGCAAGRVLQCGETESLMSLPNVKAVIAPADLLGVAKSLGLKGDANGRRASVQMGARALLRIQDGCDEHCTFCITTIARGNNRSRATSDILREALELSETHAEIVITGTHIGSYGTDTGSSLSALMELLVDRISGARLRLSSLEATEVDARLLRLFRESEGRLTPYLHAPLQSGSDPILKRMGRHWYTAQSYRDRILELVDGTPVFGLGADIITGFPGETDTDHLATMQLVEHLPFTSLHVFPFSERAGTAALKLPNAVDASIARRRAAELRALASRKLMAYESGRARSRADVVVVSRGRGLTEDYLTVGVNESIARGDRFSGHLRAVDGQLAAISQAHR